MCTQDLLETSSVKGDRRTVRIRTYLRVQVGVPDPRQSQLPSFFLRKVDGVPVWSLTSSRSPSPYVHLSCTVLPVPTRSPVLVRDSGSRVAKASGRGPGRPVVVPSWSCRS